MLLLTEDIRYGDVIIHMIGDRVIEVENFKSILNYSETTIILQGKSQLVVISGEDLIIISYIDHFIRMSGKIHEIEFRK